MKVGFENRSFQGSFKCSRRHVFTVEATESLVTSLVLSCLDYCNSLLPGSLQQLTDKLQKVQTCLSPRAHLPVVGMLRFMSDVNQPSLPTPFYSVLVSFSVFMALSTVFHSINSPEKSPFSHSVLPDLSLSNWSF